jgi:hypothetical protein
MINVVRKGFRMPECKDISTAVLPGFPEGLEAVRFGRVHEEGEYALHPYGTLSRSVEDSEYQQLIVRAIPGWHIVVSSKTRQFIVERINNPIKVLALELVLKGSESEAAVRRALSKLVRNNGVEVEGGMPPDGSVEVAEDKASS